MSDERPRSSAGFAGATPGGGSEGAVEAPFEIDPITLEVVTEGLISIVREMRATVFHTARSVAIYEAKDFSCGLFDHSSEVVAQSEDIGAHVVPLPWSVQSAMAEFAGDLAPGD